MLQRLNLPAHHWLSLSIVGFIATCNLGMLSILPIILGELIEQQGFSKELIGWFAAINIAGFAIGGLITAFVIQKVGMLRLVRLGLIGLLICELASIFYLSSPYLLGLRLVAGTFAGMGYAGSLSAFAGLTKPVKGYSLYVLVYCLWSALVFPFLPDFLHTQGLAAGFCLLMGLAFVALLLTGILRNFQEKKTDAVSSSQTFQLLQNPSIWFVLIAYYALQTSGGAVWAYIELIGEAKEISEHFIANVLAISNVIAIPFALVVYWLNDKWGLSLPIIGGLLLFAGALLVIYFSDNQWLYGMATVLYLGIWPFLMAFYQSIQAHYDPQGKVVALGAFINMMGQATGPAIAAMFLSNQPYVNIIGLALVGLSVSFGAIAKSIVDLKK